MTRSGVFAEYHRDLRRRRLRQLLPAALVLVAAVVGSGWLIVSQPHPASSTVLAGPGSASTPAASPESVAGGSVAPGSMTETVVEPEPEPAPGAEPASAAEPAPANADAATPAADPPVTPGPAPREQRTFDISVGTRGFQAELDRCEWVRMDVGAIAPIVGAHNFCDGDIILDMAAGDIVHVVGTELDGDYQVTGSRDAHAGDDAATATAGLRADLLLQTCYWDDSGLRLVTLRRVDLTLPPTVVPDEAALTTEH